MGDSGGVGEGACGALVDVAIGSLEETAIKTKRLARVACILLSGKHEGRTSFGQ